MAKIYDIKWMDEEAGEAEVYIITNNGLEFLCYAFPFDGIIGDSLDDAICALDADNVVRMENKEYKVDKLNDVWDYYVIGEIIDIQSGIIKVDDVLIELGKYALYGDARIGDFVSAKISRLDIW